MIKSFKSLDGLQCISDCPRVDKCKLISFNTLNNICKYYKYYLLNETTLIDSSGNCIYNYQVSKIKYQMQGIQHLSLSTGCAIYSLTSLPNGNLAIGCNLGLIKICDIARSTCFFNFTHVNGQGIYSLAVIQNKYLASAGQNGTIAIWDYNTGILKNTLYGHANAIYTINELNNNDLLSGSCDSTVRIWNINDGSLKLTLNFTSGCVYGLIQLKNGNLATMNTNTIIKIWNPFTGSLIQTIDTSDSPRIMTQLNNGDLPVGNIVGNLTVYDPVTYKPKYTLLGHNNDISRIIQLENDDIVSSSYDHTVLIWDWNTKSLKFNLTGHSNEVWGLSLLKNGYLVTAGKDSKIIVWK